MAAGTVGQGVTQAGVSSMAAGAMDDHQGPG